VAFCVLNVNGKPLQIIFGEGLGLMCCVPGRCPCWPREQPFDAAEVRVLTCIQNLFRSKDHSWRARFEKVKEASTGVDRRRLSYVLSTAAWWDEEYSQTLLMLVAYHKHLAEWVLNVGVCPNIGGYCHGYDGDYRGWQGGVLHPGRPPRRGLRIMLQWAGYSSVQDHRISHFLAYGAYPGATDQEREGYKLQFPHALGQWHRWHARASRRLWVFVL
jgi:hypothetical protein